MSTPPLGQKESQNLEFKSRESLRRLSSIGREVVGMLNGSERGEIWVGIGERESVGVEIEPIANADQEGERLRDFLLDTIEPPPGPKTIQIKAVDTQTGPRTLILVKVDPHPKRQPYALVSGNNRLYVMRVSDRLRGMTREELRESFSADPTNASSSPGRDQEDLTRALLGRRTALQESGFTGLWLGILPSTHFGIDVQDPTIQELLRDPTKTGNRPMGWNFASRYLEVTPKAERVELGTQADHHKLTIFESGQIDLTAPLERLYWKGPEQTIYPWSLLEYPASVIRLAATLYNTMAPTTPVATDIGMFGISDWTLRPGSPGTMEYDYDPTKTKKYDEGQDVVFTRPLFSEASKLVSHPDEVAFRLIRNVYQAFGLTEDAIPREFDRTSKKLNIPD